MILNAERTNQLLKKYGGFCFVEPALSEFLQLFTTASEQLYHQLLRSLVGRFCSKDSKPNNWPLVAEFLQTSYQNLTVEERRSNPLLDAELRNQIARVASLIHNWTSYPYVAEQAITLVKFYAENPAHCPDDVRAQAQVHLFLKKCYELISSVDRQTLLQAMCNVGYYDLIMADLMLDAIPALAQKVGSEDLVWIGWQRLTGGHQKLKFTGEQLPSEAVIDLAHMRTACHRYLARVDIGKFIGRKFGASLVLLALLGLFEEAHQQSLLPAAAR